MRAQPWPIRGGTYRAGPGKAFRFLPDSQSHPVMTEPVPHMRPADLAHGDRVRVWFIPPYIDDELGEVRATAGDVMTVVGQIYIASTEIRSPLDPPHRFRIDDRDGIKVALIETGAEVQARKAQSTGMATSGTSIRAHPSGENLRSAFCGRFRARQESLCSSMS